MAEENLPQDVQEALAGRRLEDLAVSVTYKNWQGQVGERKIIPLSTSYGSTEYHKEPQWLLRVWDVDKRDYRVYAMRDIQKWGSAHPA